jgi:diguanylate cyclase (GGDEF)-like protein
MERTRKKTVLVADDEKSVKDLVGRSLEGRNYRVIGAGSGVEALRLARARRPELILLDLEMPEKDGREVLRELKRGVQTRMIPVVMLTGSAEIHDKTAMFALGADDYITKPFAPAELAARLGGLLRAGRGARSDDPLTRLPGGPAIEEELNARIRSGRPFSFLSVDIDNFTSYNAAYGHAEGDELLLRTAGLLLGVLGRDRGADDFAGHLGGDDFVAICAPEKAGAVARGLAGGFDRCAGVLRPGSGAGLPYACASPAVSLSIGIVNSERRRLDHCAKVLDIAAEITRYLKRRDSAASAYLEDRRADPGGTGAHES